MDSMMLSRKQSIPAQTSLVGVPLMSTNYKWLAQWYFKQTMSNRILKPLLLHMSKKITQLIQLIIGYKPNLMLKLQYNDKAHSLWA